MKTFRLATNPFGRSMKVSGGAPLFAFLNPCAACGRPTCVCVALGQAALLDRVAGHSFGLSFARAYLVA